MTSSNEGETGGPTGVGPNDFIVDTQSVYDNKADTMVDPITPLAASEGVTQLPNTGVDTVNSSTLSLEVSEGAPILLDTTIDHAVTMTFLQTPEVFAGRAISPSAALTESSDAGTMDDPQNSAKNVTTPADSDTGPSDTPPPPSPPHFTPNRSISLISRALGPDDKQTETTRPPESSTSAIGQSLEDIDDMVHLLNGTGPYFDAGKRVSPWLVWNTSVVPLDAENTILKGKGEHYKIPNSDLWLFSYDRDQVMPADRLEELIRPDFYTNIKLLGAQKAIEAVNGRRVEVSDAASSPPDETKTARSDAAGIANEEGERNKMLPAAPSSSVRSENVSNEVTVLKADSDSSNAASENTSGTDYAHENVEMDGTLDKIPRPLLSPIHLIRSGSLNSVNTVGTPESESGYEVSVDELCRFVDTVRAALPTQSITDDDLKDLTELMDVFLDLQNSGEIVESGGLGLIARIRFDKLLEDLAHLKTVNAKFKGLIAKASSLQRTWKELFRGDYLLLDRERLETMLTYGTLHGLTLDIDAETKVPLWHVRRSSPIIGAHLKPGCFWLNIECAYRDGIVESNIEKITPGKYDGTPTLPLLTGTEVDEQPGRTRYRKQCSAKDMPYNLMTKGEHFQGKVRILRGHELVSKYAPKAGVRYDGEYLITGWAHLPTPDLDVDIRHFELVLERVPGQPSYLNIPSPAQLDDWHLYQRYVTTEKTRATKAYSNLLTDERDEADRATDIANTEWEFDQIMTEVSNVMEKAYGVKH